MSAEEVLLRARGLVRTHRRGGEVVHALHGVDLDLAAGEVVAVTGPSGSGKSSLLTVLAGWEPLDAGTLDWAAGLSLTAGWQSTALIPQSLGLLEELTVRENVGLPLRLARRASTDSDADARVAALLADLDLTALTDRAPGQTSLGEQQRTCVARALVLVPRLVLADEPTAHQDSTRAAAVLAAFSAAAGRGACVVMATHAAQAVAAADRVVELRGGAVAAAQ